MEMIDHFGFKLADNNLMKKNEIRFWVGHAQASRGISKMILTFQNKFLLKITSLESSYANVFSISKIFWSYSYSKIEK